MLGRVTRLSFPARNKFVRSRVKTRFVSTITRSCLCGEVKESHVGAPVDLWGWVDTIRPSGSQLLFTTLKDYSGSVQLVLQDELVSQFEEIPEESVVWVRGHVRDRPDGTKNKKQATGNYEILIQKFHVLNKAINPLPTERFTSKRKKSRKSKADEYSVEEEHAKLQQRILYLRTPEMQRSLRMRSEIYKQIRTFLDHQRFIEVETPTLFKRTSEGAKEFIVPSSSNPGKFYALVQSPQQYKQLLMAGGIDRYYQIARCYRDEALRADRQPEFTQLDMELSCTDIQQVYSIMENLLSTIWESVRGIKLQTPFRQISYRDALSRYGSDKPDTRFGFEIQDVTECVLEDDGSTVLKMFQTNLEENGKVLAINVKGLGDVISPKQYKMMPDQAVNMSASGLLTAIVTKESVQGEEDTLVWKTPINKLLTQNPHIHSRLSKSLNAEPGDLILISCEKDLFLSQTVLGKMRLYCAELLKQNDLLVLDPEQFEFLWVTRFPLLSRVPDCNEVLYECSHHPFTAPVEEDIPLLKTDPDKVRGQHYDCVVNGVELGGGSIRIHQPEVQMQIFKDILNLSEEQISHFSHLLEALQLGCPPHGGIAFGLDRMCALLAGKSSIRDVIAFPKSNSGRELLTGTPTSLSKEDLADYLLVSTKPELTKE